MTMTMTIDSEVNSRCGMGSGTSVGENERLVVSGVVDRIQGLVVQKAGSVCG